MENVKCQTHPNQSVNNFCKRKQCMVGLCPTCICQHTQQHHLLRTLPDYQNIQQTYEITQKMVQDYQTSFTNTKDKINKISTNIENTLEGFWELFKKAKSDYMEAIEKCFNDYEEELKKKIKNQEMRLGCRNEENLKQALQNILIEEQKIQQFLLKLQNAKSPALVRQVHMELLPSLNNILKSVSQEVNKFPQFQPKLNYKKALIPQFRSLLTRTINLDYNYPKIQANTNQIQIARNISPVPQVLTARVINKSVGKQMPMYNMNQTINKSIVKMSNKEWMKENSIGGDKLLSRNNSGTMFTTF